MEEKSACRRSWITSRSVKCRAGQSASREPCLVNTTYNNIVPARTTPAPIPGKGGGRPGIARSENKLVTGSGCSGSAGSGAPRHAGCVSPRSCFRGTVVGVRAIGSNVVNRRGGAGGRHQRNKQREHEQANEPFHPISPKQSALIRTLDGGSANALLASRSYYGQEEYCTSNPL